MKLEPCPVTEAQNLKIIKGILDSGVQAPKFPVILTARQLMVIIQSMLGDGALNDYQKVAHHMRSLVLCCRRDKASAFLSPNFAHYFAPEAKVDRIVAGLAGKCFGIPLLTDLPLLKSSGADTLAWDLGLAVVQDGEVKTSLVINFHEE